MPEEIDEDLQDLLNQLDDQDEFLPTSKELAEQEKLAEVSVEETSNDDEKPLAPITGDEVVLRPVDELTPTDIRVMGSAETQLITPVDSESNGDTVDLAKYLTQMDGVTQEVLQACRSDRQEAQDVINILRKQVDDAHNKNQSPSRMYVDGLVKAVEVKAGINATAVKMMEGVGKMIAATKSGVTIQNNNLNTTSEELDAILNNDVSDDFGDD